MKKLTIEEKAKAYDEAIKRVKNIKTGKCKTTFMFTTDLFEYIFPELKESEDERIKDLIYLSIEKGMGIPSAEDRKKALAWLEKQGEKGTNGNNEEIPNSEQNPADKVEPKFKAGDFVVVNDGRTGKIIECTKDFADVDLEFSRLLARVNNIRSWTIEDAKAGDVLYCKSSGIEYIVMSKGVNEFGNIDSYFRYNSLNGFGVAIPAVLSISQDDITPATKEQCDFLFQKMKEAGYEWDAEKKELKKIEQNPAWNEKDEKMLNNVIDTLKPLSQTTHSGYAINSMIDWLKSLKSRHTWKPSKEQMSALDDVIDEYDGYPEFDSLVSLKNDLKKLKG